MNHYLLYPRNEGGGDVAFVLEMGTPESRKWNAIQNKSRTNGMLVRLIYGTTKFCFLGAGWVGLDLDHFDLCHGYDGFRVCVGLNLGVNLTGLLFDRRLEKQLKTVGGLRSLRCGRVTVL
jgi:hypothetical protein